MFRSAIAATVLFALSASLPNPAHSACPSQETMQALAANILANRPSTAIAGMTSLEDGWCAPARLVPLLTPELGQPIGYKVGLTAENVQRVFGVPHPVRGVLYAAATRRQDGAEVPAAFGAVPRVEADFLLRVRSEAINDARDHMAILRELDVAIPFIELPDLVLSGGFDGPNLLAINVGARLGVVGTPVPLTPTQATIDRLAAMVVVTSDDTGREYARAPGTAVLGHPLNAVAFLIEDLPKSGLRLRAGDILSVAGFSAPLPPAAGRTYTVRYEGLAEGPVSVSVRVR
jgi:2-keto-4-pentenoate hydratase